MLEHHRASSEETMWDKFVAEFGIRGGAIFLGFSLGAVGTWLLHRLHRWRQRNRVMSGDARDTIVINHHIVEVEESVQSESNQVIRIRKPRRLRIRSLGQGELNHVVPNDHLASVLTHRSGLVTCENTLISMEGAPGSYLLETLTNFVCDRVTNSPFQHDLYVMAPCCEPAGMAQHQPITILLIKVSDLQLFNDFEDCHAIEVEHNSDGARVLTLLELAKRFRDEQSQIDMLRMQGKRTRYVETMYLLDLPLDQHVVSIPTKPIPWKRFEDQLKALKLGVPSK
jgi:hypothetical protein